MRRLLPSPRRLLATVAGGAAVGLAATVALAGAAFACAAAINPSDCTKGSLTWTVKQDVASFAVATVTDLKPAGSTLVTPGGTVKKGEKFDLNHQVDGDRKNQDTWNVTTITQKSVKPGETAQVNLHVDWYFDKEHKNKRDKADEVGGPVVVPVSCGDTTEPSYKAELKSTCTDAILTLTNSAEGPVNFIVNGETVSVPGGGKPFEKKLPVSALPADKKIQISAGKFSTTLTYKVPEGCESASSSSKPSSSTPASGVAGASSSAGTLPVTGTNTAIVAGGAIVLLGAGAGLFMVARRRRIKFTA